jgi:WD40 repeat protein
MRELLDELRPGPGQEDLRGLEWYLLWKLAHRERLELRGHTRSVLAAAFAPGGQLLATGGWDGGVRLWDPATGALHGELTGHPERPDAEAGVASLAFSPDGKVLASGGAVDARVRLWDVATRRQLADYRVVPEVSEEPAAAVCYLAFTPGGRALAVGTRAVTSWRNLGWRIQYDRAPPPEPVILRALLLDPATGKELAGVGAPAGDDVVLSPDGTTAAFATGGSTPRLVFRDLATGRQRPGPDGAGGPAAFSPDGRLVAAATADGSAKLMKWDGAGGKDLVECKGRGEPLTALAFTPDGKKLVTNNLGRTVRFWDAATGEELAAVRGPENRVLALTADGRTLATANTDGAVQLWDVPAALREPLAVGNRFAWSADGKAVLTWDASRASRKLELWDAQTCRLLGALEYTEAELSRDRAVPQPRVDAAALAPDGRTVATWARGYGQVRVWNVPAGDKVIDLPASAADGVAAFSPDGKILAVGEGNVVRLWDTATWKERAALSGADGRVVWLAFCPDGTTLLTGQSEPGGVRVRLWDTKTWEARATLPGAIPLGGLAVAPDGRALVSWTPGKTRGPRGPSDVRLWDPATGKLKARLNGQLDEVLGVTFSPDGKRLVTAVRQHPYGDYVSGEAILWDVASGEELARLKGHTAAITSAAFSPDGRTLATGGQDRTVRLWDAATGRELFALREWPRDVTALAVGFSPDGRALLAASTAAGRPGCQVRLWHAATAEEVSAAAPTRRAGAQ